MEGYIIKILPINKWVVVSGKITFYKNKYQITNPDYVTTSDNIEYVKKLIPKYSLTEGIGEKSYRRIIEKVLKNLPKIKEWHEISFLKKMNFLKKVGLWTLGRSNAKTTRAQLQNGLSYD